MPSKRIALLALLLLILPIGPVGADDKKPGLTVVIHSHRFIEIRLGEHPKTFPIKKLAKAGRVTLFNKEHEPYAAKPIHPARVGYQKEAVRFYRNPETNRRTWPLTAIVHYSLFAELPHPMQPGQTYQVSVDLGGKKPVLISAHFDEAKPNRNIKVNQLGYLPDVKEKYAYLGGYLGTLGPLRLAEIKKFELIDEATGKPILNGKPKLRKEKDFLSGEDVYEIDLSSVRAPGRYHLFVPGMGRSYPFEIRDGLYAKMLNDTQRFFYHQRCGIVIGKPHTEFPRPAWHDKKSDGFFHKSIRKAPLHTTEKPGDFMDVTGGWHDAGDSGKYTPTATESLHILMAAYEMFPEALASDATNIPESGNEIPDLLDEIHWELAWLLKMQGKDGAVYHKVTHPKWGGDKKAPQRIISEKTTHDTGSFAAVMAAGARLLKPHFPKDAEQYLAAAHAAAKFLAAHPNTIPRKGFRNREGNEGGEYDDDGDDRDERAWAAAEIFKTTGDPAYHKYYLKHGPKTPGKRSYNHWAETQQFSMWTYLTTDRPGVNKLRQANFRKQFLKMGDNSLKGSVTYAYRSYIVSLGRGRYYVGYGSGSGSARGMAFPLARAYALTHSRKYLDGLALQFDTQLGTNALGRSWVTGYGSNRCMFPTHGPSGLDDIDEPVPGMKLPGPYNRGKLHSGSTEFEKNTSPRLPGTRIFYDISLPVMGEPTIDVQAHQLAALAAIASWPKPKPKLEPKPKDE